MGAEKKDGEREHALGLIPSDAVRVRVVDAAGNEKWRDISEGVDSILESDSIPIVGGRPLTMKTAPGRRPKPAPPPLPPPTSESVAQLQAAKQYFLDHDALLNDIDEKGIDSENILYLVMKGIAQEAASLAFERSEAERTGKETSQLSLRRIGAFKQLGEMFLKRKEQLAGTLIDLDSPAFVKLFAFILDTFREAMLKGGVPRDAAETVFVSLSQRMSDESWETEARNRMKNT